MLNFQFIFIATANQSIFVRNQENAQYPYKLKTGVHFHLYINTAPCGDARIFSPHENDSGIDKHPNRFVNINKFIPIIIIQIIIITNILL